MKCSKTFKVRSWGSCPHCGAFSKFFSSRRRIPGRERAAASAVAVKVGNEGDSFGGRRPGAAAAVETAAEAADADAKEGGREGGERKGLFCCRLSLAPSLGR